MIAAVPDMGADETEAAIAAAKAAMGDWALTAKERCNVMKDWYRLIMENQEDLAQILTASGKPLAEARVRLFTGRRLLSGMPKRPNVFMAILFLHISRMPG